MIVQRFIEIQASPGTLWPYLTEPELILKWFTFLTKYEYKDAERGGAGAAFYWQEKQGFMFLTLHYRITEWTENKTLSFKLTSGPVKKDDQVWRLEETQAGCKFTITTEIEFTGGAIDNLIRPIATRVITRNIGIVLKNLKAMLESQ